MKRQNGKFKLNDGIEEEHRQKFSFVREIVPHIADQVLWRALRENNFAVEVVLDILLNGSSVSSTDESVTTKVTETKHIGQNLQDGPASHTLEGFAEMIIHRGPIAKASTSQSLHQRRGSRAALPALFLRCPARRVVAHEAGDREMTFTLCCDTRKEPLGFTLETRSKDGAVVVSALLDLKLRERCGLRVGDELVGVNGELFAPFAELPDVSQLLAQAGRMLALHWRRRFARAEDDNLEAGLHPSLSLYREQDIVSADDALLMHRLIASFKRRVARWNDEDISRRIEQMELDRLDGSLSPDAPTSLTVAYRSPSRREEHGGVTVSEPLKPLRRRSLSPAPHVILSRVKHVRSALCVHLLRAETAPSGDYTQYVMWVSDVRSGVEWFVKRRFREFMDFRETLLRVRPQLKTLEFPAKKISAEHTLIAERLPILQRFVRVLVRLCTVNESHPSTIRMQLVLQRFLAVEDHVHLMALQETLADKTTLQRQAQLFLHAVMHTAAMDGVVRGFVDRFLAHSVRDVSRAAWTESDCGAVCEELAQFLEHMQNFLCDAFLADCLDLVQTHPRLNEVFAVQSQQLLLMLREAARNKNKQQQQKQKQSGEESLETDLRAERLCDTLALANADEMRVSMRSAIRHAVEMEVYLPCCGRVGFVLQETLRKESARFESIAAMLRPLPQRNFGVLPEHVSPSNWASVVAAFHAMSNHTLPCDKIESVLSASRALMDLFREEHPNAERGLGADEMLPVFLFVIVQARVPNMVMVNYELQALCEYDRRMSESGYFLATLQAAISHIMSQSSESSG